jgi:thiamine-monophosphate kinase
LKLTDIGEDELVRLLVKGLPLGRGVLMGPGDDCAVVARSGRRKLLLKTDCVVEGVHFLRSEKPARVGWKALCRPLSDIGAMGGDPLHALVTVFTPSDLPVKYWEEFYKGLKKAAKRFGVGIVGGEVSRTVGPISVNIALTGEAKKPVLRSGGKAGHRLFVTGTLGGSIRGKHLDFIPRIAEGKWLAENAPVTAMMDLSDGLSADLPRLARASGCGFRIDTESVPKSPGCTIEQALGDGEDYELLFAVRVSGTEKLKRDWRKKFPKLRLTEIGVLTSPDKLPGDLPAGFDHFSIVRS